MKDLNGSQKTNMNGYQGLFWDNYNETKKVKKGYDPTKNVAL